MGNEEKRKPYEFSSQTKDEVYDRQNGRCAITGRRDNLECHHILPIAISLGFWKNIDPDILKDPENAVYLNSDTHHRLHEQMRDWPKDFFRLYITGLFSYLRDYVQENKLTKKHKVEDYKNTLRPDERRRV